MSNAHRVEPCPTVAVRVFSGQVVDVDAGIAPLVSVLTGIGIATRSSCEGHPRSEHDTRAYVVCDLGGTDVELRLDPKDTDRLAHYLARVGRLG